jgi:hypothetical protein
MASPAQPRDGLSQAGAGAVKSGRRGAAVRFRRQAGPLSPVRIPASFFEVTDAAHSSRQIMTLLSGSGLLVSYS